MNAFAESKRAAFDEARRYPSDGARLTMGHATKGRPFATRTSSRLVLFRMLSIPKELRMKKLYMDKAKYFAKN